MSNDIIVIGTPISPYVRKVLVTLELKGIEFNCVPQVPFFPTEEFKAISPLGQIPILKHGDFTLADSSVIVQYLEDLEPTPAVFPHEIKDRAKARWFEEYADQTIGRGAVFNLFFQKVVRPILLKQESDEMLIKQALEVDIPNILDYLEPQVPEVGYMFGDISIADVALCSMFLNAQFAGWAIDKGRWPKFAAYKDYVYAHPAVGKYNALAAKLTGLSHTVHQDTVNEVIAAA